MTSETAPKAARRDQPGNASRPVRGRPLGPGNPHRFKKGNSGRPKGAKDRRTIIGLEAARALEAQAWEVVEKLLRASSWRARHEAAKVVLAYSIGLPKQTLAFDGISDVAVLLAGALQAARDARANAVASPELAALPAATSRDVAAVAVLEAPAAGEYPVEAEVLELPAPVRAAPGAAALELVDEDGEP